MIVIAPDDPLKEKTISNLQECRARGAKFVSFIRKETHRLRGGYLYCGSSLSQVFSPLLTVLPLQLLAYKAGLALDRNIDRPRRLAKSVTVD